LEYERINRQHEKRDVFQVIEEPVRTGQHQALKFLADFLDAFDLLSGWLATCNKNDGFFRFPEMGWVLKWEGEAVEDRAPVLGIARYRDPPRLYCFRPRVYVWADI
jgi:hypothetical protein